MQACATYSGWEIATRLESLQGAGKDEGSEEENAGPKEHIRSIGSVVAARRACKLSVHLLALLEEYTFWVMKGRHKGGNSCCLLTATVIPGLLAGHAGCLWLPPALRAAVSSCLHFG